jgi:acetyl esterase/lipase
MTAHPPFDPELAAALAAIPLDLTHPLRAEDIPAMREQFAQMMLTDDETLRRGGAVELQDRQVPGPPGAPDLELDREGIWDRTSNLTGWTALLGAARGGPGVSPYAAPARARDLSGLPPAYIDVGTVETFRDEAIDYAARLCRAGVNAELHMWAGGFHAFEGFAPQAAVSQAASATRLGYLRRALAP